MPHDNPRLSLEEEAKRAIVRSSKRGVYELIDDGDIFEPLGSPIKELLPGQRYYRKQLPNKLNL
jgi:hypothetical protein